MLNAQETQTFTPHRKGGVDASEQSLNQHIRSLIANQCRKR
jgi:hypothetical protein